MTKNQWNIYIASYLIDGSALFIICGVLLVEYVITIDELKRFVLATSATFGGFGFIIGVWLLLISVSVEILGWICYHIVKSSDDIQNAQETRGDFP
jgi:hypothetical protein